LNKNEHKIQSICATSIIEQAYSWDRIAKQYIKNFR